MRSNSALQSAKTWHSKCRRLIVQRSRGFAAERNRYAAAGRVGIMPTLEDDGWELESAEERNRENPRSFGIASLEERSSLKPGAVVKLLFLFMNEEDGKRIIDCERMRVTILEVRDERYLGSLDDSPVASGVIAPGQIVEFGPEHVAAVTIPRTDPRHPYYQAAPTPVDRPPEAVQLDSAALPGSVVRRWWGFWK